METVFLSDQDAALESAGAGTKDGADVDNQAPVGYSTKALGSFLRRANLMLIDDVAKGGAGENVAASRGRYTQIISGVAETAYAVGDAGGANGSPHRVNSAFVTPKGNCYEGTSATLTEGDVQAILQSIYDTTGVIRDYDAVIGTALKRKFTNFTQSTLSATIGASPIKTFSQDASSRSFINAIDVFEGDFGRMRLHPSTFISELSEGPLGKTTSSGTTDAFARTPLSTVTNFKGYVIPFDQVEIRYSSLPNIKELTDNGGGPARLIQAIAALVVNNPQNFGYFDCDNTVGT
jgi:hypothetical protein